VCSLEAALHPSRRDFLKQVTGFACAYGFSIESSAQEKSQVAPPHLDFPARPRDRLAVTSWPFRAYIASPANRAQKSGVTTIDMKEFPAMVVEKFGVYNVNPLLSHFSSTDPAYLASFREAVAKARSHIVDLGLSGGRFATSDSSVAEAAVKQSCQWIDIAVAVGSPSVRQHLAVQKGETPDPDAAADHLSRLADYGGKRNIVVNLENDNAVAEDPYFIVGVLKKVNHPYLRALPDFGNSIVKYGEEANEKAVAAMLPHAFNMVHVKGMLQPEGGPVYHVDLKKMFAIARQSSYPGYYSMEFDTNGGDPFTGTTQLIDETLKNLA
jgi:sugar phosphate isomerase/epimerase